ncbi:hypothetical protein AX14_006537 [Amanita brunnescens Koide BX004]|nr:hypothetical protein AX14_006537 [Amanita brunnescens Koide BX004]
MRMMAAHHIYREVKPDIFTNNRISSLLDTRKPSAEVIADPSHKYDNTYGMAAMSGHMLDEQFKASAHLWEIVSNPKTAKSGEPNECPFTRVIGNGKTFWEWVAQPENAFSQRRFDIGMRNVQAHVNNAPIIAAYDWKSLPANSLVVDVGGGIGTTCLALAKEFPSPKFVVQDRQPVIEAGIEVWKKELPDALSSGRAQFQAHDFFAPQPQTNASIFLLKHVLHDWSDKYSLKILKQLRDAATPDTKLVVLETIMPYACHDTEDIADGITFSGAAKKAPNPLLANWGAVAEFIYVLDMTMLTMFNSQERTIRQFDQLFRSAGWKIAAVRRGGIYVHLFSSIIAIPI